MRARAAWAFLLIAGAVCCHAQVPIGVATDMAKVLKDNNYLHDALSDDLPPDTDKGLPPKEGIDFLELGDSYDFTLKHADTIRMQDKVLFLDGHCLFLVRGYRVSCDEAQYDRVQNRATLIGHVHIDGNLFAVPDAGEVSIDFAHNTYVVKNGDAQLSPQLLQGGLRDKVYVNGRESFGDAREITTLDGSLTTCNYPVPHYDIEARNIVLRPGRRVIFRHTKIRILGYVVAQLPFLSIPLDDRSSRYIPYVGEDDVEGYFAKFLIGVPTKNPNYNIETHEDFMTRLGVGLGVDYSYLSRLSAGTLSIYHVFGSTDDLVLSSNHRQIFGWGTVTETTDFEHDNYLVAPGTTSFNTKISAMIPQGTRATDQITFTDATTSSSGYSNGSESLAIDDRRDFGNQLTSSTSLNYFASQSSEAGVAETAGEDSQRLDVNAQIQKEFNPATLAIQYQRSIPIGASPGLIANTSDETPVITLTSDARKLLGAAAGSSLPFQTALSWGDFEDSNPGGGHISRAYFDFNFNKVDNSQNRFKIDFNGDFHQGFYSDDTAQYVLGFGTNMRYDLGGTTGINLRYNYLRPYGYTPLEIDSTGYTNYSSADLNFKPYKYLLLGAQTGYDFSREQAHEVAWQQVSLRSEFQPAKYFLFRGLYTYDTFNSRWEDVRLDLTYIPGATQVTVGADYDPVTHYWTSITATVDNFKWGKLKTSLALSYDGALNQFDSEQYNFVYDLHCAEAVLTLQETNYGFNSGTSYSFFIRLKAFPFDSPFGSGTRGQSIGANSGPSF